VTVIPIVLDSRPAYLGRGEGAISLLTLPLGARALLDQVVAWLSGINAERPRVLPTFEPDSSYVGRVREAGGGVDVLPSPAALRDYLAGYEPSDSVLIIDPRCFPSPEVGLESLIAARHEDPSVVRHLLALETSPGAAREFVHADASGRLRKIQRYYHPVTWPFAAGLVCSLVPLSCALTAPVLAFSSLTELRRALAERGVPSRDIPLAGGVYDLNDEGGLLALSEYFVHELARPSRGVSRRRAGEPVYRGARCTVHPTARLIGPVALTSDVTIEAGAVIVGPALIGPGAHVGRDVTVAQCVVAPGARVSAGLSVRHRLVLDETSASAPRLSDSGRWRSFVPRHAADGELDEAGGLHYRELKRLIEAPLALAMLLVLSPLLLVIALLVKLTSRGPVLYGDLREGKGGRPFHCWKFRSMRANAHAMQRGLAAQNQVDGPQFKLVNDPRVTRVGMWLRRLNLDELPQLINVVRGEMSLIGPRPSPFRENQTCVGWRQGRLSVRPGVTGLWQVCRHDRSSGDFHQWIQYDLLYVRHMSAWLDLKILVATLLTLGGKRPVPVSWLVREPGAHDSAEAVASQRGGGGPDRGPRQWLPRLGW
jgi:lipopolysaccharide/colanic/teichoic acid biosynthesis glycosyltransferase